MGAPRCGFRSASIVGLPFIHLPFIGQTFVHLTFVGFIFMGSACSRPSDPAPTGHDGAGVSVPNSTVPQPPPAESTALTPIVVDFALMPIRDLDAFAPPAAAVLARDPASLQEFRATEADASAWAEALRAIDNHDGMVSTVELSQRADDGSALGVASWCWNEDASWDVEFARAADGSFRIHVSQTPVDGGVERADLAFSAADHAGVVFVFAGHPTDSIAAGRLVLAVRVREVESPAADDARSAWNALWDMSP